MTARGVCEFEELPPIAFTPWRSWGARLSLPGIERPGLYVIAYSPSSLDGKDVDPTAREVIDIGQTTKQTLRKRLGNFDRSAFRGVVGIHSAGESFRRSFPIEESSLWVAIFSPAGVPLNVVSAFIKYAERKLLLEYALRWGKLPACNRD